MLYWDWNTVCISVGELQAPFELLDCSSGRRRWRIVSRRWRRRRLRRRQWNSVGGGTGGGWAGLARWRLLVQAMEVGTAGAGGALVHRWAGDTVGDRGRQWRMIFL